MEVKRAKTFRRAHKLATACQHPSLIVQLIVLKWWDMSSVVAISQFLSYFWSLLPFFPLLDVVINHVHRQPIFILRTLFLNNNQITNRKYLNYLLCCCVFHSLGKMCDFWYRWWVTRFMARIKVEITNAFDIRVCCARHMTEQMSRKKKWIISFYSYFLTLSTNIYTVCLHGAKLVRWFDQHFRSEKWYQENETCPNFNIIWKDVGTRCTKHTRTHGTT